MPVAAGTRLGPYEVVSMLGAGGMGEVYRARDLKLGREVALKILPDTFAGDADRLARFRREAQVLASLNHPNIAAIYGLEDSAVVTALVLELVDGPTLADRIAAGPIPLEEALTIARQVAEALDAAHERGIIHRDLKPANIKVRPDGAVKVLDFGLAKAMEDLAVQGKPNATVSPTITSPALVTGVGLLLGTAAYMAPEQARGKVVDKRADVWAFGCVLYEMLAGARAFEGDDIAVVLASVIKSDPDWTKLPSGIPRGIVATLKRCLRKDPRLRLRDIGDAQLLLAEPEEPLTAPATPRRSWLGWAAAALLLCGLLALGALHFSEKRVDAPVMRTSVLPPDDASGFVVEANIGGSAISPDGRQLAFVADAGGKRMLYVRSLDSGSARALPGTDGAARPFWSPDSRNIGFFAAGKLQRIGITEGAPRVICDVALPRGASWNADGVIIFSAARPGILNRVSASGGTPTPITMLNEAEHEQFHYWPHFLPDGSHFLYLSRNVDPAKSAVYVGTLADKPGDSTPVRLVDSRHGAIFAAWPGSNRDGFVVFVQGASLMAQPFDAATLTFTGEAFPIADNIGRSDTNAYADVSASRTGILAFGNSGQALRRLAWVDRDGRVSEPLSDAAFFSKPRVSPDGRNIVTLRSTAGNPADLWRIDLTRSIPTRLTFGEGVAASPVWLPDGSIVYEVQGRGIFRKLATGTQAPQLLFANPVGNSAGPMDVSQDGKLLLYVIGPQSNPAQRELWTLPLEATGNAGKPPSPYIKDLRNVSGGGARFSRGGTGQRWVAYASEESPGRQQVYVQDFPDARGKWQVSRDGGRLPVWSRDGKELFFLGAPGELMSVRVTSKGTNFQVDAPKRVFVLPSQQQLTELAEYDVAADGRFVFLVPDQEQDRRVDAITVLQNWQTAPPK